MKPRLHLFDAYGVELEYMIVDSKSLNIKPIADELLKNELGEVEGEMDHGVTSWSNELVSHVIELKSNGPTNDFDALEKKFHSDVVSINKKLQAFDAQLLSTAAHPWMNPSKETKLWEHDANEIYHAYDRIFNCKGHGWSNLQSVHINLPFFDDEEFARLHTAIRFLLPIIPALTASSPILDGKFTGYFDKRLYYYEKNQSNIPVISGKVIPEKIFSKHGYYKQVYDRIQVAIKPHDPENILKPIWLNSRGAIARFDRGAIEIRVIDIQECPKADMAVVALLVHILKLLVSGKWISFQVQESFETDDLYTVYKDCVKDASKAKIQHQKYVQSFGIDGEIDGRQLWAFLIKKSLDTYPNQLGKYAETLQAINKNGTLSERIMERLKTGSDRRELETLYHELARCLEQNILFKI